MRRGTKVPAYRLHAASGQAIVSVPGGGGAVVYLGKHGTAESKARYSEVVGAWLQGNPTPQPQPLLEPGRRSFTCGRLAVEYLAHCREYYRDSKGNATPQFYAEQRALREFVGTYETLEASQFGPLRLVEFQASLANRQLTRTTVAHYIGTIKRAFKWATVQERIGGGTIHGLREVPNLRAGRSRAKEPRRVLPVSLEDVERTLPFLSSVLADAVRVQTLTGCRAGELLGMKWEAIDRTGPLCVSGRLKTGHSGAPQNQPGDCCEKG